MELAYGTKVLTTQKEWIFSAKKNEPIINSVYSDNESRALNDNRLHLSKYRSFTLINIYDPNYHTDRKVFLEDVFTRITQSNHTILGGNFNCVKNPLLDKSGGRDRVGASSRPVLQLIKVKADLKDIFRSLNPQTKSFIYFSGSAGVHSKLDRFYVSSKICSQV